MSDRAPDGGDPRTDPAEDDGRPRYPDDRDAGAFIGRGEPAADSIPGGVQRGDERVSAVDTQSTGVGDRATRGQPPDEPSGHREGDQASDDDLREAGDRQ